MPPKTIDKVGLLEAFDAIGAAAVANHVRLEIAVYGGSALILAGNFRFTTEDVDISEIGRPWPAWLAKVIAELAQSRGWSDDWLNDAVTFHLSPRADRMADHVEFGSFPREGRQGLTVSVPTAEYMLALKLKAIRLLDPAKGAVETDDIYALMKVLSLGIEGALAVLSRYFPKSGVDDAKQRFLLKHLAPSDRVKALDAPVYPR